MSAISPCYPVAGLLVCYKAVIESADRLETSDSGRTRKSRTSSKKSWVERGVGVLAKRGAEGTKRACAERRIGKNPSCDQATAL